MLLESAWNSFFLLFLSSGMKKTKWSWAGCWEKTIAKRLVLHLTRNVVRSVIILKSHGSGTKNFWFPATLENCSFWGLYVSTASTSVQSCRLKSREYIGWHYFQEKCISLPLALLKKMRSTKVSHLYFLDKATNKKQSKTKIVKKFCQVQSAFYPLSEDLCTKPHSNVT